MEKEGDKGKEGRGKKGTGENTPFPK